MIPESKEVLRISTLSRRGYVNREQVPKTMKGDILMKNSMKREEYEKPTLVELGSILTLTEGSEDYNGDSPPSGEQYNGEDNVPDNND